MGDGIVTHLERTAVDPGLAAEQHGRYVDALAAAGWKIRTAPPADELPDSAFIEDTMVVCVVTPANVRRGRASARAGSPA
jgi:dimethylargininase